MLHAYITSYAICFMATVVIIMLLLIAGVEIDKEEAKHHGAEVEPPPTAKDLRSWHSVHHCRSL